MFETLQMAPPDAILGLTEAFKNDPNPEKINLSVGVYKDANGQTPVLRCVKQAEKWLVENENSKGYLGIDGLPEFSRAARELLFGVEHPLVDDGRATTLQTPGGTAALRVAGELLAKRTPVTRIWCSKPTWANHPGVFAAAGLDVDTYAYIDQAGRGLDFDAMLAALNKIPAGDAMLLHACCHNPTGIDPTVEQWRKIAAVIAERDLVPLVDFAYQGFGSGLHQDAAGLHELTTHCNEMLVCSSYSKNFGLYSERVGALTIVSGSAEAAQAALSHAKACVRTNYSNPPRHGAAIVATVLASEDLRDTWNTELTEMRQRINGMRTLFAESMAARAPDADFSFITEQRGMFSFSGLTPMQVDRLRTEFGIYIVGSGRINVAGMTESNMQRLCDSIAAVL